MRIIILGLPRSGTTLLGRLLLSAGNTTLEEEPVSIWRYRNYRRRGHDQFSADDACDEVRRFIRRYFERRHVRSKAEIQVEKTPANALRPEFVTRVFPEAKIIVLQRDRLEVENSIYRRVVLGEDANAEQLSDQKRFRRLRIRLSKLIQTPFSDLPAYLPPLVAHLTCGAMYRSHRVWGPRHAGWHDDAKLPMTQYIERQVAALSGALNQFVEAEASLHFCLDYQDLLRCPDAACTRLEDHIGFARGDLDRTIIRV